MSLRQLLKQELAVTVALLETLDNEHEALGNREPERVKALLETKERQVAEFERIEWQRKTLLAQMDVAENNDEIRRFLASDKQHGEELVALWDRLIETAARCRERNQANGSLVEIHRRHVQRALDILRGTQPPPTYGPQGQTQGNDTHSLAKA